MATHQSTDLWSDSDAGRSFGTVRPFTYFQLTGQSADGRLYVLNPYSKDYFWIDADAVGPVAEAPTKATGPKPPPSVEQRSIRACFDPDRRAGHRRPGW